MVTMGLLLATSEMDKYYANPYFQIKMCLLLLVGVHAVVFRRSVYGNAAAIDQAAEIPASSQGRGRRVAGSVGGNCVRRTLDRLFRTAENRCRVGPGDWMDVFKHRQQRRHSRSRQEDKH